MKAITICQPWATFWALLFKGFETRGWKTAHRGALAIHAGKADPVKVFHQLDQRTQNYMYHILARSGLSLPELPRGAVVGIADLQGCFSTDELPGHIAREIGPQILLGNYGPNRYAWKVPPLKVFEQPIACSGKQGLWNWEAPDEVVGMLDVTPQERAR
jgi:hypothetical protein